MARVNVGEDRVNTYFFDVPSMKEEDKVTPSVEGFYVSSNEIPSTQNPGTMTTVHKLKTKNDKILIFWGTGVLNDKISKFTHGQYVYIDYLGTKVPQKKGGKPYHNFSCGFDDAIAPQDVVEEVEESAEVAVSEDKAPAKAAKKAAPKVGEDESDLPF